jgi:protein gp37
MSGKTGIEWTEATWNPVTGCTKVSQGCKHCYAERDWARLSAPRLKPNAYTGRKFTDVAVHPERLDQPLRWIEPRRIFVNSMSDLFHEAVPDELIDRVFGVMALAPRHTFQILTKRPERMRDYLRRHDLHRLDPIWTAMWGLRTHAMRPDHWPLHNVWLGVSVEDQHAADERIPLLQRTPAAVRWISAEPLLGSLDLSPWLTCLDVETAGLVDDPLAATLLGNAMRTGNAAGPRLKTIDWVVVGGESGPNARPMSPDWARLLRDQCAAAGVPFLFKQWGEWVPMFGHAKGVPVKQKTVTQDGWVMGWAGKKAAGRLLDGVLHDEYPEARRAI